MKKTFQFYAVFWAVLLAVFNVIAFVSPGWIFYDKYTASFWLGYTLITLTFIGQLICAYIVFKGDNLKKQFYRWPLFSVSYTGLIFSFIVGGLCMLCSPLLLWIGILVCVALLAVTVIAVLKAGAASKAVSDIDATISKQTSVMHSLIADAEGLAACAGSEEAKVTCKKVYEALRFSDPVSSERLETIENQISGRFKELKRAVQENNSDAIRKTSDKIIALVNERNSKCKSLK